jgi:hypothetical protein
VDGTAALLGGIAACAWPAATLLSADERFTALSPDFHWPLTARSAL